MRESIMRLLEAVAGGTMPVEAAFEELKDFPFQDLTHTKIDHQRHLRKGIGEVIFGEGKTFEQIYDIVRSMREKELDVLATRVDKEKGGRLLESFPEGIYSEAARSFVIQKEKPVRGKGMILIVSAGTSDIPVAEEAYTAATFFGNSTERLYDVGVAGIHRLFANMDLLKKARVIIVAAGMEGALPSIVAGIVGVPVIAIPTSVGYGASLGGFAALLSMLNSCSTVAVFNIDNGFGAAYFATLVNRL
ncbi:MAG: nickel pincer cofactor biosynthesis protein LarB [Syntrophorhabdales bacterium]|jgi:NCAIR mutase (PurE)-related protein